MRVCREVSRVSGLSSQGQTNFLTDPRRGIASYEALASRLNENEFAVNGLKDISGPVIRLDNLTPEDLFVLFHNIRNVFSRGDPSVYLIPDDGITRFMGHCSGVMGAEFHQTPREAVKMFGGFFLLLEKQHGHTLDEVCSGLVTTHCPHILRCPDERDH